MNRADAKSEDRIEVRHCLNEPIAPQGLEQLGPARRPDSNRRGDNSALESEIAAAVALDRSAASELERSLAPALNVVTELLVAGVVELKPSRQ